MTFGYNINATFGQSTAEIVNHVKGLFGQLSGQRTGTIYCTIYYTIYTINSGLYCLRFARPLL
jgi:hypothetical protein